ncbi:MAG TPA: glycosyltransferase, partial [Candidatus Acidoferrales bacterium]|nr:glycosyltransferase [Candidatus Acidoferrales bacterium]
MKVAIDIHRVLDYGAGTYTRNLISTLAALDRENAYTLVGTAADWDELGALPANFSLLEFDRSQEGGWQDLRLGWRLRREKAQVFHSPYLASHFLMPCPQVVTVHDAVDFLDLTDGHHSFADLLRFQRTRLCLNRARRVLTVSQATRRDLQRLFGLPEQKIVVVYNALDARLAQPPTAEEIERTLTRYSVQTP